MPFLPRSPRGTWLLAGAIFAFVVGVWLFLLASQRDLTAERFAQIRDTMTSDEISELLGCEPFVPIADFVDDCVYFGWETADGTVHITFGLDENRVIIRRKSYDKRTLWWSLHNWLRTALKF